MASYNQIIIVGNCGGEPEMRYLESGDPVTSFSVAVDNGRFVNEAWKEDVEWYRVSCFGKMAESVNRRLTKGEPVMVVGRLKCRRWDDKEGKARYSLEVRANKVISFSKKKTAAADEEVESDMPF